MAMNPAKYTKAQEDAKKYMESHNLERLVAIMYVFLNCVDMFSISILFKYIPESFT